MLEADVSGRAGGVIIGSGATVIDEDFGYTGDTRTAQIKLRSGLHPFRLYYMPASTPLLDLEWSADNQAPKPIPPDAFCLKTP